MTAQMKNSKKSRAALFTRRFIAVSSMFSFVALFFAISTFAELQAPVPVPSAAGIPVVNTPAQDGNQPGSLDNSSNQIDDSQSTGEKDGVDEVPTTLSNSIEQYVEAVLSTIPDQPSYEYSAPATTSKPTVTSPPATQPRHEVDHEDEDDHEDEPEHEEYDD